MPVNPLTKPELRSQLRESWRWLLPNVREQGSEAIRERLRHEPGWNRARSVLLFAPRRDEPDIWPMVREALDAGKVVALPAMDPLTGVYGARRLRDPGRDLVTGPYGIREPGGECPNVPLPELDLILVPGLAFTSEGGRLGRGGGFYDRLLAATGAIRVGIALDEQIVPAVPLESHDQMLDYVLTPSVTYRGPRRSA